MRRTARTRGIVLVSTLLLLIVMTIIALAMYRNIDVQEMIAGNVREKQRAFQAATDAEQFAEYWLSINDNALTASATCGGVSSANASQVQICSNLLSTVVDGGVTSVPWQIGGAPVGFSYNPGNNDITAAAGGQNTYFGIPNFYISVLSNSSQSYNGPVLQVDAWSYGGNNTAVAEVESTWQVEYQVNSNIQGGATGN